MADQSRRYPGRSPAYVRLRVEYCAARGKSGNTVKIYLSRSFSSPAGFEATVDTLAEAFGGHAMTKREREKLRKQVIEARRRSMADVPSDVDLDVLMKKREQIAKSARARFSQSELLIVFRRVPLRDFQSYSARVQTHLVRYLAHKNETSRTELKKKGLRWSTYIAGQPKTLFAGRKRA